MASIEKKHRAWTWTIGAAGAAGATAAACAACCVSMPLLASALGWLGLAGIGAMTAGWSVAAMLVALGLALLVVARRRASRCTTGAASCDCTASCKISPP